MISITRGLQNIVKQVNVQTNIEAPAAALTLTRSATLAIATAGTTITWQVETRNSGFVWSGTGITIPTAGYYAINLSYSATAAHTASMRLIVNGVIVAFMATSYASSTAQAYTVMRYFATGNVVRLSVLPSSNVTVNVVAEGVQSESPILHIVQLSASV